MKITSTPDLLIIDNRPWILGVILIGSVLGMCIWLLGLLRAGEFMLAFMPLFGALFLSFFVWMFVRRNQLILNAADQTMIHRRQTLANYRQTDYDLGHLQKASVDTSISDKGGATHRMILHVSGGMNAGDHPFVHGYVSGNGAKRSTAAVNDWLSALRDRDGAQI